MKHLKKLSVVLMLTTLFSVTFTSCIDNEVSPVVEAIYEAQADLIAAQAGVQNAEAAYLLAQAEAEQAQAAYTLAQAAQVDAYTAGVIADNAYEAAQREQYLLQLVAQTNLNVANLQNQLELAEVAFQTQLAAAIAAMEAAGVQLAADYAWDYAYAMMHANNLMADLLDAKADLADAQLMQTLDVDDNTVSWAYALAQLQGDVDNNMAAKADLEAAIAAMEAYIADPSTPESIISGLKAQNEAYHAAMDAKEIEMQIQYNKIMELYEQNSVRNEVDDRIFDALDDHNDAVNDKNALLADIEDAQDDVADLTAALGTYAADLAAATTAVTTATAAYTTAWTALGKKNGAGVDVAYNAYFEVDADGDALIAGATKYAAPANLQQVYVNARIDVLDATADLAAYQADFDALVVTYNNAAVALAAAQATYDAADYAGDLVIAQTAQTAAQLILTTAQATYAAAKTAFEADPTGSVTADGDGNHSNPYFPASPNDFDLGNTGIASDLAPNTFMRVATWKETTLGSNLYIPATYFPTKYNSADLAVAAAALIADGGNAIGSNSDIWLWSDNVGAMLLEDIDNNVIVLDAHNLSPAQAIAADTEDVAVFVDVELDDTSVSKLYTFNVATNKLGTNNFSSRPFFTSGAGTVASPYVFNSVLTPADLDAGYDSMPNSNGIADSAPDMLTAQAALWNAKLEVFKRQNDLDLGDDLLAIAQNAYDYQKELFDNGVANLAALTADKAAAITAQTAAKKAVDQAWLVLGAEYAAGTAADALKTTSTAGAWYYVNFVSGTKALTLNAIVFNAEVVKAKLAACNAVCIQGQIDVLNASIAQWTQDIANIQPIIDAKYAVVAGLLGTLTAEGVEYTFEVDEDGLGVLEITNYGILSSLYPDLHAAIIAEWQVYWTMEQELDAIDNAHDLNADLISAYGWSSDDLTDLAGYLADLKDDLAAAITAIEVAEQALASAQVEEAADEAYLAYLQALIDTLEARHANTLAIAAKYKALMEAALAS